MHISLLIAHLTRNFPQIEGYLIIPTIHLQNEHDINKMLGQEGLGTRQVEPLGELHSRYRLCNNIDALTLISSVF